MAKRFTDTNKYKKPFMRSLKGPYKLFWDYLYHECDHAGIWIVDFVIAQVYLGADMPVNREEALKCFNSDEVRVYEIAGGKKWFIKTFVEFQYGILDPRNRVHNSVLLELQKQNINKDLIRALQGPKDKEKEEYSKEVKELYSSVVIFFEEKLRPHTEKQVLDWHDTLDKCIRIDGYSADRIQDIVKRMRMDDFWRTNFMSIMKLRQTNKQGVKYIDFFDARLKGSMRPAFGIPQVQRDYTTPQTSFS
jgi:hypothetical protein